MLDVAQDIQVRGVDHDNSKLLNSVEIDGYGRVGPYLTAAPFGSKEFETYTKEMQPAIDSHMCTNRHHVESHVNGIRDMNLIDLIEMLADWKAAGARQDTSSIDVSIDNMSKRYGFGEDVIMLLRNTAAYLKY